MNSDNTTQDTAAPATDEPRPLPRQGDGWSVRHGSEDKTRCYPTTDTYTWSEFAGVAIHDGEGKPVAAVEMGGYCDLSMVDPYTLQRLWVADVLSTREDGSEPTIYDALRALIDIAEREQFLG